MTDIHSDKILILDFGAQYTQLIARRIREIGVYCEIWAWDHDPAEIAKYGAKGIILSGGPESTTLEGAPKAPQEVFDSGLPILGICYGMQTLAAQLGGATEAADAREFGHAEVELVAKDALLGGLSDHDGEPRIDVWMSHGDHVAKAPPGWTVTAVTDRIPVAAMALEEKRWYGVQFHPEVTHTKQGQTLLRRFVSEICGCKTLWTAAHIIEDQIARVREQVGSDEVILGLSGGVDSSVVAALLHRAIGEQLTCVFVDTGLLRWNEGDQVMAMFAEHMGVKVIRVNAADRYFNALEGVDDPEAKRKIIGNLFVEIFDEESSQARQRQVAGAGHDLSRRDRVGRQQDRQGPRHQEPPQRRRPARAHEARPGRAAARAVQGRGAAPGRRARPAARDGLPPSVPGPGPGRAHPRRGQARVRRAAGQGRPHLHRRAAQGRPVRPDVSQAFAVFLPVKSVGVVGDARAYEWVIALRAVETIDFMTAHWAHLPYDFLGTVSNRIINELRGVSRVVYDISGKPPATIEWE